MFLFEIRKFLVSAKALNKFEEEEMSLVSLEESREESQPDQPMWIHTADEVEFEIGRFGLGSKYYEDEKQGSLTRTVGQLKSKKELRLRLRLNSMNSLFSPNLIFEKSCDQISKFGIGSKKISIWSGIF